MEKLLLENGAKKAGTREHFDRRWMHPEWNSDSDSPRDFYFLPDFLSTDKGRSSMSRPLALLSVEYSSEIREDK